MFSHVKQFYEWGLKDHSSVHVVIIGYRVSLRDPTRLLILVTIEFVSDVK